jgi:hypothetical protein
MTLGPVLANAVWLSSGVPHIRRFHAALRDPRGSQDTWLRAVLARHAESQFGQRHEFHSIATPEEFARRVPVFAYDDIQSDISRITRGERNVLASGTVTHLAPTSGSTGARKLIPFTADLTAGFNAAVFPWLFDLVRHRPGILGGPAYWSISPIDPEESQPSAVPVGFADDAEYLGGPRAWLVRQVMAVPSSVRHERDPDAYWRRTLLPLLARRDLRFISIWHPSFLDLLVRAAPPVWDDLLAQLGRRRAGELRAIGPHEWTRWWPELAVLSCWGEQAAEPGWRSLVRQLPGVMVQRKGLLATECVVTIPVGEQYPVAITSHYFEFLDESGNVRRAHQLERGGRYEVVVTNGAGLWRYRLGDLVECTGHLHATPSLAFRGRLGRVTDLRGEKLSEPFVADVLAGLWTADERPGFAVLRPRSDVAGYELLVSSGADHELPARLDRALSQNPHYDLARRLGQLEPARVVNVGTDAELDRLRQYSGRLGEAKPVVLLTH